MYRLALLALSWPVASSPQPQQPRPVIAHFGKGVRVLPTAMRVRNYVHIEYALCAKVPVMLTLVPLSKAPRCDRIGKPSAVDVAEPHDERSLKKNFEDFGGNVSLKAEHTASYRTLTCTSNTKTDQAFTSVPPLNKT